MDEDRLMQRACAAYLRHNPGAPSPSAHRSEVKLDPGSDPTDQHFCKAYIVLANVDGLLAVYRYNGRIDRLRRLS